MFNILKFKISRIDHVGIRMTNREVAREFYETLGFAFDPEEESPRERSIGLVNRAGARINLIYNGETPKGGNNVLMDVREKWPCCTYAAFVVDDLDALVFWLNGKGIKTTEGPSVFRHGRQRACSIRDPDGNVIEFDEIPSGWRIGQLR